MNIILGILQRLARQHPNQVESAISHELDDRREAVVTEMVARAHSSADRVETLLRLVDAEVPLRKRKVG